MGFSLASLIFFLSLFHSQFVSSSSTNQTSFPYPQCHSDESSALFQFNYSFSTYTSSDSSFHPIKKWDESTNCCTWSGVTCERVTGHVIGLDLSDNGLRGVISSNSSLFSLRYLRNLDLSGNDFLGSNISPKFGDFTDLTHLNLSYSNFSGLIPFEITRLSKLVSFRVYDNEIEISLATFKALAQNSSQMRELSLRGIDLSFLPSPLLTNLSSSLTNLDLSMCNLHGELPENIFQLMNLQALSLSDNNFIGELPEFCINSSRNFSSFDKTKYLVGEIPSKLSELILSNNLLNGTVPAWIYSRSNLQLLDLSSNSFTGEIGVEELSKSTDLMGLKLSYNNLSLRFNQSVNHRFYHLRALGLSSCNISEFPNFIKSSKSLWYLDLSQNQLHGSVPKWLWGMNFLHNLNLSHNFLTHIEPLPWKNLTMLDLRSNFFSGTLPIILSSLMWFFSVSKNQFSGEIPNSICDLTSLEVLDFSFNNLSGEIPQCMGNFSEELSVFALRNNKLKGTIPTTFSPQNKLRNLNLNGNLLEGELPRALESCKNLEVLDLGNNLFEGTFPYWLESLPELRVLVLRSNKFRGSIENPQTKSPFQKLRIMDLSTNEFSGALPRKLFKNFEAMMDSEKGKMGYMGEDYYQDSVMVTMKGLDMELEKILTIFTTIDFSKNNFSGEIPESIGRLKALKGLNFSHNKLTGGIPWSLRNLTNLEWLDLSSNDLLGEIPVDLADIPWLAFLNLSHNHLEGPIPQGKQFNTFSNDSFIGNLGLCGFPLTEKCIKDTAVESLSPSQNQDVDSNWFDWKIVAMGYVSGLVIGMSLGYMVLYSNGRVSWLCERMIFRILHR